MDIDDRLGEERRKSQEEFKAGRPPASPPHDRAAVVISRAETEAAIYDRWLTLLDPGLTGVARAFFERPTTPSMDAVFDARAASFNAFAVIFRDLPGSMLEKFKRVGSPAPLMVLCGLTLYQMDNREWDLWFSREELGRPHYVPRPGSREKPVIEPETGAVWASASDLAKGIGCAPISAYKHLGGALKSLKGRVFQYVDAGRNVADSSTWSEAEKEEFRAAAAAYGFTSRI